MFTKTRFFRVIYVLFFFTICTPPVVASSSTSGQDWYCQDPVAHEQYERHLQQHLNHSSDLITEKLDAIYSNSDFSAAEKKKKTVDLLEKYLSRMKAGIGD